MYGSVNGVVTEALRANPGTGGVGNGVCTDGAGTNYWNLGGFTGSGDAASNGSVSVDINGTSYKLMTKA